MGRLRGRTAVLTPLLGILGWPAPLYAQEGGRGSPAWWLFVVLGLVLIGFAVWLRDREQRKRRARSRPPAGPPLIFPAARVSERRQNRPMEPAPFVPRAAPPVYAPPVAPPPAPPQPASQPYTPPTPAQAAAGVAAGEPAPLAAPTNGGSVVDGSTIRFHKPADDGTLQILPGRLEVVSGGDSGQSIRFVRTTGPAEVTFGRSGGPAYRHIQLFAPTVSREHAQMRYDGGTWKIENRSRTNPVVVNGEELDADAEARSLADGDRIEMGEVVFVYRER